MPKIPSRRSAQQRFNTCFYVLFAFQSPAKIPPRNSKNAPKEAFTALARRNSIGNYAPDKPAQDGLFAYLWQKISSKGKPPPETLLLSSGRHAFFPSMVHPCRSIF